MRITLNSLKTARDYVHGLRHFHPLERFSNAARVRMNGGEPLPFPAGQSLNERAFHLHLRRTGDRTEVVKLLRGDNQPSCNLLNFVRQPENAAKYRATLLGLQQDAVIGEHCVGVTRVRADGGYDSEYVDGLNLAQLRTALLHSEAPVAFDRAGLTEAVTRLIGNLRKYRETHGRLAGDWALHNLVFIPREKRIVNVDAKEFCPGVHTTDFRADDFEMIAANFEDLNRLIELSTSTVEGDQQTKGVLRVLDEVRRSGQSYSGVYFLAGYHSLTLRGRHFRGQRECAQRLARVPFNFQDKVVVDLGCNCGGMLHALAGQVKRAYGFDYNPNCVNAANAVKSLNGSANLEFFTFDLDRQDLSLLPSFMMQQKADICFLLAVCMWLERWPKVIEQASKLADTLLFESNGTLREQDEQMAVVRSLYSEVQLLSESSPDDPLVGLRRFYLCHRAPGTTRRVAREAQSEPANALR